MSKIKKLSLSEVKQLQIDMLVELDKFCRKNNINYSLSFGTLLGAIRHKGYIPWDDDVDVMLFRSDMNRLVKEFPAGRYKVITFDNESNHVLPFPRLVDTTTFNRKGRFGKDPGVFIDLYFIDAAPATEEARKEYVSTLNAAYKKRRFFTRVRHKLLNYLPVARLMHPVISHYLKKQDDTCAAININDVERITIQAWHQSMPKEWFTESVEVDFEGHKMLAPRRWHEILTDWYGDYMQLPPEDKRHPYHGSEFLYQYT